MRMPKINKPLFIEISIITIIALLLLTISCRTFLYSANALTSPCNNGVVAISNKALPVAIFHIFMVFELRDMTNILLSTSRSIWIPIS
jgi:branched-subunit amino acid transport protein AzlD